MVSTIRLLPPEVLSNIFLLCLPDKIKHHPNFKLERSIPGSISRVCRKWRYVCVETSRLWVHIPTIYLNREAWKTLTLGYVVTREPCNSCRVTSIQVVPHSPPFDVASL